VSEVNTLQVTWSVRILNMDDRRSVMNLIGNDGEKCAISIGSFKLGSTAECDTGDEHR